MADPNQSFQQHPPEQKKITVTPSGLGKEDLESGIEELLSKSNIQAVAVVIISPTETTTTAKGHRKYGHSTKVTETDNFMIGPMSSTMVSVILARLIEKGVLNWSSTLRELLADFGETIDAAHHNTTIKMLSSHVSGITTKLPELEDGRLTAALLSMDGYEGRRRTLVSVLSRPPERTPGPGSSYRNAVNLMILAFIVEKITGLSWEIVVEKEVFEPLKMTNSGVIRRDSFQDCDEGAPTKPCPHEIPSNATIPVPLDQVKRGPWLTCAATYPALGVHSTLSDVSTYLKFCLHGAAGVLNTDAQEILYKLEPELGSDFTPGGFDVFRPDWADEQVLKCRGHVSGFTTGIWIAPKLGYAFAIVANVDGKPGAGAVDSVYELLVDARS